MNIEDHGERNLLDGADRLDEKGQLVGSIALARNPVAIPSSHPYVAYWGMEGGLGACNTCGTVRPMQYFGAKHAMGSCSMCGSYDPNVNHLSVLLRRGYDAIQRRAARKRQERLARAAENRDEQTVAGHGIILYEDLVPKQLKRRYGMEELRVMLTVLLDAARATPGKGVTRDDLQINHAALIGNQLNVWTSDGKNSFRFTLDSPAGRTVEAISINALA